MPLRKKALLNQFLKIAPDATRFGTRGFHIGDLSTQQQLELSASTFVQGYHIALASDTNEELARQLDQIDLNRRGFAYEGAAMALAMLDFFFPRQNRFRMFTQQEGDAHLYMLYVGWGWTMGRLPRKQIKMSGHKAYDPLLAWLAYDGYGFHEGFFFWEKRLVQQRVPRFLPTGYARRAFDQGLGRSLWFVGCGDISYIQDCIQAFPQDRQPDLWSGIGLACAYAGGVSAEHITSLITASKPYFQHLTQGVAFAVKARQRASNPGAHTTLACQILCQRSPDEVVSLVDSSLEDLAPAGNDPAYELWRKRIRTSLSVAVPHT